MNFKIATVFLLFLSINLSAQDLYNEKGTWFVYWGWNNSVYTKSNIRFKGENYNFTLDRVVAHDRQSPFSFKLYFSPKTITIPQYNIRIAYSITKDYTLSLGTDHMKYVADSNQVAYITGNIAKTNTIYDKSYSKDTLTLKRGFLLFEHTDGLNYINLDLRKRLYTALLKVFRLDAYLGAGAGILYPRTNTTLLNYKRYDEFHLAGFGSHIMLTPRILWRKHFFVQSELKFGFIDMPDIRTTEYTSDRAKQFFWFLQANYLFGWKFKF